VDEFYFDDIEYRFPFELPVQRKVCHWGGLNAYGGGRPIETTAARNVPQTVSISPVSANLSLPVSSLSSSAGYLSGSSLTVDNYISNQIVTEDNEVSEDIFNEIATGWNWGDWTTWNPDNAAYSLGDIFDGDKGQSDLLSLGIEDSYKKSLTAPFVAIDNVKDPEIASFSRKLMQAYDLNNNTEKNTSGLASLLPDVTSIHRVAMDMPFIEAGKQIQDQELSDFYQGFISSIGVDTDKKYYHERKRSRRSIKDRKLKNSKKISC